MEVKGLRSVCESYWLYCGGLSSRLVGYLFSICFLGLAYLMSGSLIGSVLLFAKSSLLYFCSYVSSWLLKFLNILLLLC